MKRPNILIILSDQLRRNALGCYGNKDINTPNIDTLSRTGVLFDNAYSTCPVCVPFRFTFMTGEYAHTRAVANIHYRMSPAERTIADEFNEAGYDTMYCGKWHLDGLPHETGAIANLAQIKPSHQGRWKKWLGFELANDPFNTFYFEDDNPEPRRIEGYQTDGLFDLTMDYIKSHHSDDPPFVSVLSVEPPHFPLEVPDIYLEKWSNKELELPPNLLYRDKYPCPGDETYQAEDDIEALIDLRKRYYAMIENLDWNVGRMIDVLKETGKLTDTIIVFMSDHGQMDGAHAKRNQRKTHPYEESTGIPLIVNTNGALETGTKRIKEPVCTEDIFPTLLGLAGLVPKHEKPGLDLTPLVTGEITELPRNGILLEIMHDFRPSQPYHKQSWRAFRSRKYKYTVLGDDLSGGKPWQFFDLQNDPFEMDNLIDDLVYADEIAEHHKMLRDKLEETEDYFVLAKAFGEPGFNTQYYDYFNRQ